MSRAPGSKKGPRELAHAQLDELTKLNEDLTEDIERLAELEAAQRDSELRRAELALREIMERTAASRREVFLEHPTALRAERAQAESDRARWQAMDQELRFELRTRQLWLALRVVQMVLFTAVAIATTIAAIDGTVPWGLAGVALATAGLLVGPLQTRQARITLAKSLKKLRGP
jgi:ABC-type multidrug transport system fused ATPase/permease subunit